MKDVLSLIWTMHMFDYSIRGIKTEQELAAMFNQRWLALRAPLGMAQGTERDRYDDDNAIYQIAIHPGKIGAQSPEEIVGSARLRSLSPGVGSIAYVAISFEFQCQGIGSALIQNLIQFAQENSYLQLRVMARTTAIGFYQRLGFVERGESINHLTIPHVFMHLDLCTYIYLFD
jgi:ribosomal protein S18 acetylase RimI-like enzyme